MRLEARAEDVGDTSFSIPAQCHREGQIAFDLKYLLDYLRDKDGMVTLATAGPNAPGLFSYRGVPHLVLMPMFVQPAEAKQETTPNPGAQATPQEKPGTGEDDLPQAPEPTSTPVKVSKAKSRRKKK